MSATSNPAHGDIAARDQSAPASRDATPPAPATSAGTLAAESLAAASARPTQAGSSDVPIALPSLGRAIRGPAIAGIIFSVGFCGGFGVWAATAPLAGATIAVGQISPNSHTKTIQHLEGGIVREIFVREGSTVSAGDVLMTLDDIKARTSYESDALKYFQLDAQRIRLETELSLLNAGEAAAAPAALPFPAELTDKANQDASFAALLEGEERQFQARWQAYQSDLDVLQRSIAKAEAENAALQAQIATISAQSDFLDNQISIIQGLVDKGLDTQSNLAQLQRERLQADEDRASLAVRIASNNETITLTQSQIENSRKSQVKDVANELAGVRSDLATTRQRMEANADTLARTVVRSPVDGSVVDLQVHTIGGVVAPGEAVMTIVPSNDDLVVDAQISPNDIDTVHTGLPVEVSLLAYPQRRLPLILGTVTSVSADAVTDSSGNTYYLGQVEVDPNSVAILDKGIKLVPGMQVELKIMTEERTFFEYLIEPLLRAMNRTFVES